MRDKIKKSFCIALVTFLLISTTALASTVKNNSISIENNITNNPEISNREKISTVGSEDIDELVDLELTVTIKEIRALDTIDIFDEADFYVKVLINEQEWWTTQTWENQNYVKADASNTIDVDDYEEFVNVTIQLWDENAGTDKLCDISGNYDDEGLELYYINLIYDLKTGHWRGDDFTIPSTSPIYDLSGYGRACGCDDNTYKIEDRDCELTFDITQNDYDGDGIPWWTEVYFFGTDPEVDNTGMDEDEDGVPIEWEYKWGHYAWQHHGEWEHFWEYDPFVWNDHEHLDPDDDGLQNTEEYITSQWGSDPFRQDIFIELDQMEVVEGVNSYFPQLGKDMLRNAYAKHNIVVHIDDHEENEMTGGEIIPFMEKVPRDGQKTIYNDYFLHNGDTKWRQGIFHYAVIVYSLTGAAGFAFWGGDESYPYNDGVIISTKFQDKMSERTLDNILNTKRLNDEVRKAQCYASTLMHETGHILGIYHGNTPGCDNRLTYRPSQIGFWMYAPYKSCMNYRYVLELVDYSDGSHGKNDWDDWERIDLALFQGT